MPATKRKPAHSDNFGNIQAPIHVFPCSKFQKKGNFVFSSLSTITGDLSPKGRSLPVNSSSSTTTTQVVLVKRQLDCRAAVLLRASPACSASFLILFSSFAYVIRENSECKD